MGMSRIIAGIFLTTALLVIDAYSYAHEPVMAQISGVLLRDDVPLQNALIIGCMDIVPDPRKCDKPFETKTDSNGEFTFVQASGYPRCTVCPCIDNPKSIDPRVRLPSCDPNWRANFSVLINGTSAEFDVGGLGYGFEKLRLTCKAKTWSPSLENAHVITPASKLPHTRKLSLRCNLEEVSGW